jgi:hypothetical protein
VRTQGRSVAVGRKQHERLAIERDDFDDFIAEIEAEARTEGPEALAELEGSVR